MEITNSTSHDPEQQVLGAIIKDETKEKKSDLLSQLEILPSDFDGPINRSIYNRMLDLREKDIKINVFSLSTKDDDLMYLGRITHECHAPENAWHYAAIIRQKALARATNAAIDKSKVALDNGLYPVGEIVSSVIEDMKLINEHSAGDDLYNAIIDDGKEIIKRMMSNNWIIDGLVRSNSFGVVYGASGTGKSFVTLGLAMHVAKGSKWGDLDTCGKDVIYISAEGGSTFYLRKRAWEISHNDTVDNMRILHKPIFFDDQESLRPLSSAISRLGDPCLIVIDTLARCMSGDENNAQDMNRFINGCDAMRDRHGCSILVVHHTGKDADKGARGSSSLKAACDFEIEVSGSVKGVVKVESTKAKDSVEFEPVSLKFDKVTTGETNAKGDIEYSLVGRLANFGELMAAASSITDRAQTLLDIIGNLAKKGDYIEVNEGRKHFYLLPDIDSLKQDNKRQAFNRSLKELDEKLKIKLSDGGKLIELI